MSAALKGCPNPWCTSTTAALPVRFAGGIRTGGWRAVCGCGVRTPKFETAAEAVTAWNSRPQPDALSREEAAAIIEQCAQAAEAQDRTGREWVRDSLWANILKRAAANVRAQADAIISRLPASRAGAPDAWEQAALICEQQAREFLALGYAAGQPHSSFSERFACAECAQAIRDAAAPHTQDSSEGKS